jgi:hypothetical protein
LDVDLSISNEFDGLARFVIISRELFAARTGPNLDRSTSARDDARARLAKLLARRLSMHVQFLGKDPESQERQSPTLFATDRTDRKTYIAQGWKVTDPQALADIGPVPDHETLIEIPE